MASKAGRSTTPAQGADVRTRGTTTVNRPLQRTASSCAFPSEGPLPTTATPPPQIRAATRSSTDMAATSAATARGRRAAATRQR